MSNLQLRVISAIVMVVAVLTLTWIGGWPFRMLAIVIGAGILNEWFTMSGTWSDRRLATLLAAAFAAVAVVVMAGYGPGIILPVFAVLLVVAIVLCVTTARAYWGPAGFAYAGLSAIAIAGVRDEVTGGLVSILFLFSVVWATDIFAYFVGRAIGGPKLAPRISPGKTWSGAIGGATCAVIAGTVLSALTGQQPILFVMVVALAVSVASQMGDLFESWVKRRFGFKDSGHLIPGHGGVMDRVDGLVIGAMMLYLISITTGIAVIDGR